MEIKTHEEYCGVLDRIVKGSEYIAKEGLSPEQRKRALERYDELWEMVGEYQERIQIENLEEDDEK